MRLVSVLLLASLGAPAAAQLSSGGPYSLERSAQASGGKPAQGGKYSARGATGGTSGSEAVDSPVISGGPYDLRVGLMNPPPFALQASSPAVLAVAEGALLLAVPANLVPLASYDIVAQRDPVSTPVTVDPNAITRAIQKLGTNDPLARVRPEDIWEFHVAGENGLYNGAFAGPVRLSFAYADADGDGDVDGTSPPMRTKGLSVWTLDENASQWVKVPGATVDAVARSVSAPLTHFSVYALIAGSVSDVEDVYPYPIPFRARGPDAGPGAGQTGTDAGGITFTNLPSEGTIEVYTLSGQLVRRLHIPIGLALAKLVWDVRNYAGEAVTSGVYIWKVASKTSFKTGRLMVIR